MNAEERRRKTAVAAERRKRKIKEVSKLTRGYIENHEEYIENIPDGKYRNNNIANSIFCGWAKKTKTRKSCASYRHHGGYGKAQNWKPHDQRQIDKEKDYEDEI